MTKDFYYAFEAKFRGSKELIKKRLEVYSPFLEALKNSLGIAGALDLGCGRGEWLELLKEKGFDPQGVDIDEQMLATCKDSGLSVQASDALEYICRVPDESLSLVSAFHLIEHVDFGTLQRLIIEAKRILVPGGLLILETPNPDNIVVGTSRFYLDPTHQRPIPAELLSFLVENSGFDRAKVLGLQESIDLLVDDSPTLIDVLTGVSPDYAVVAQKNCGKDVALNFDIVFGRHYGLSLNELCIRFQDRIDRVDIKLSDTYTAIQDMRTHAIGLEDRLSAVYNSTSWRITAPIRWVGVQFYRLRNEGVKTRLRAAVSKLKRIVSLAYLRLVNLKTSDQNQGIESLSPHARDVYNVLQKAKNRGNKH